MTELICNLELALEKMAELGNHVGIRIIQNALTQANKINAKRQQPSKNSQT